VLLTLCLTANLCAQKRNKKDTEPPTQVLAPLPDPPDAVVAETARLSFQVSPLSSKGLLTPQIRDALKALLRDNHGAQIVKLRAFVAGSGDLRRVQTVVAEEFTDRKLALPALSTIQVGALPMVGAQVVIEATSVEKRIVNPDGVAFFTSFIFPDFAAAVADLRERSRDVEMLRVTCYASSLSDAGSMRASAGAAFPNSAIDILQTQRLSLEPFASCEGAARMPRPIGTWFSTNLCWFTIGRLVITGTKLVFRDESADIRLAFDRLGKAMEPLGASLKDTGWIDAYALTRPVALKVTAMTRGGLPTSRSQLVSPGVLVGPDVQGYMAPFVFEGLPSTDATAAIELMAAVP
jgi:hypothetical protein